ncbi:MAG: hypothetical protein RBT76_13650 [candidate division Zixibacteria bacterium]|jgi:hypothetical protein|nr:hypothetical protein [candidate division Zixibacteria bacterium]
MKSIKCIAIVCLVCAFAALNGTALFAKADVRKPKVQFSAGDQLIQGGQIVGCMCPKDTGPCVCQYNNES